ncbi:GtrA family protein [Lysobacter sp. LF1]|uniref:GtrA family protein n=1 Tax=Lysobacter stagni TaxID=3045172 RepID=A0ABT6XF18_9GAMM|nr:GtrA family protein [Lysobacter sp. LF1]MDI9238739.1 GtrA family protein [Lysobacter sp. LF1]
MIAMFSRYVAVQIVAYAADMGSFLLATSLLGWQPLPANVLAKLVAGSLAFVAHRRITFGVHGKGRERTQLFRYIALLALNVPMSSGALAVLLHVVHMEVLAKFLADVVCVGVTFLLSRHLVFVSTTSERDS